MKGVKNMMIIRWIIIIIMVVVVVSSKEKVHPVSESIRRMHAHENILLRLLFILINKCTHT